MRLHAILLLVLAGAFLALTGESCVLETKEVEVPVRDAEDFTFTTAGNAQHSGSEVIDFTGSLLDLEDDNTFEQLLSANIEVGYWRVSANRGDADLVITGAVTVTRVSSGASATILTYQSVPIASVTGPYRQAPLEAPGVNLLNAGFDEYLQARAQGQPVPDLRFRFDWSGTATSGNAEPNVDFDWQAKVRFTLLGIVEVDVPEVF